MARKIPINEPDSAARPAASGPDRAEFRVIDKRHFTDPDDVAPSDSADDKPRYPSFVEELQARVVETERRFEQRRRQVDEEIARLRARLEADFSRRVEHDRAGVVLPLLEVLDNLERTLVSAAAGATHESLVQGVRMTADLFRGRLKGLGVEPITALDRAFDPNVSQAVGTVEVSDPALDGIVVEELQRGYTIADQLLRPGQVRVGKLS